MARDAQFMNEMRDTSNVFHAAAPDTRNIRRKLQDILERLTATAGELLPDQARQELQSVSRKFQSNLFYLVFLGQFKRGKTTLLNSLIGAELLPVGVLPLTSIVTIVKYGPEALARVKFIDGRVQQIALEELPGYVTERGNPGNKKQVAEVEVLYPSQMLEDGLCLVDTPGIGSIFEHNTQVAYDFVPQSDVAIFIFSPESPLSQTELEFLRHIRAFVEKVFFVLNKSDQVTASERAEILEFAQQSIRQQMPSGELRFFAVSARQSLDAQLGRNAESLPDSKIPQFRNALEQFVTAHKGQLLLRSTGIALRRLMSDALLRLELEQRALAMDTEQLKGKIQTIEEIWKSLDRRHRDAAYILRGEISDFVAKMQNRLNEYAQGAAPDLVRYMRETAQAHSGSSKADLASRVDQALRQKIVDILEDWQIEEERSVQETFENLTSRFTREATAIVEQIQQAAAEQFGFSWTATPLPDRLAAESRFRISVEEVVTWGLTRLPLLLPKPLFIRYLKNWVAHAAPQELYKHAGALRSDLAERLENSVSAYLYGLDRHMEETRESIRAALKRATAIRGESEAKTHDALEKEASRVAALRTIDQDLAELQTELQKASD